MYNMGLGGKPLGEKNHSVGAFGPNYQKYHKVKFGIRFLVENNYLYTSINSRYNKNELNISSFCLFAPLPFTLSCFLFRRPLAFCDR